MWISPIISRIAPLLLLLSAAADVEAGPLEDRVTAALRSPQEIVAVASRIGLSDARVASIESDARRTEAEVLRLQADALDELEDLGALLAATPIDPAAAAASFERLMTLEASIKRTRLNLWIRANATLTAAQRSEAAAAVAESRR